MHDRGDLVGMQHPSPVPLFYGALVWLFTGNHFADNTERSVHQIGSDIHHGL